jgi:putative transposase
LRSGRAVGFPRFKNRRDRRSVRFTTGTIRVEADRHHVTLPRLGKITTHESTRKLARRIEDGRARILSATLAESGGRWHVSFHVLVQRTIERPAHIQAGPCVVGVDVGVIDLAVVATPDGVEVCRIPAPKSYAHAQAHLRALQRKAARQHGPWDETSRTRRPASNRWKATQNRITKVHTHTAATRRDVLAKLTTTLAQSHDVIVVETLNALGMRAAGGARKKGLNRALADAALAEVRRLLAYKTSWYGSTLVEADRYYPSSKTCSGCGRRKPNLTLADRIYECDNCTTRIDRDLNAAINLARLAGTSTGSGPAASATAGQGRGAKQETATTQVVNAAGRETSTPHTHPRGKTGTAHPQRRAAA